MNLKTNQIYRHFKGNLYKVIAEAVHTETEESLVIYQALYGDFKVYARPLSMFFSEVDREKYPNATQKMRFEPVEELVETVIVPKPVSVADKTEEVNGVKTPVADVAEEVTEVKVSIAENEEQSILDPMVEAYLDTDSYREKLNILQGLHHRITEDMLITMAIVIDFELPEGDLETKFNDLKDCLLTKEKYECSRMG